MNEYEILSDVLIVEVLILVGLSALLILHRLFSSLSASSVKKHQKQILEYYTSLLDSKQPIDLKKHPPYKGREKVIVTILETFGDQIQGKEWFAIRNANSY